MSMLFLSDVDGVFTDAAAKPNEYAISLAARISVRHPVATITGRSMVWMEEYFLPVLNPLLQKTRPTFFFVGAEYGAVRKIWRDGAWLVEADQFRELDFHRDRIREEVESLKGCFFDKTKLAMVSIEIEHEYAKDHRQEAETDLSLAAEYLQQIADTHSNLELHATGYARDLTPRGLSKSYGAEKVFDLLSRNPVLPEEVVAIGDARSDLRLLDPVVELGISRRFYFVGTSNEGNAAALTEEDRKRHGRSLRELPDSNDRGTVKVLEQFV